MPFCGMGPTRRAESCQGDAQSAHHRNLATCLQLDVDEWLVSGSTTRSKIRNLLAWVKKARLNRSVHVTHRQAPPSRSLTQQQRLVHLRPELHHR